jgi:hypothetical protein
VSWSAPAPPPSVPAVTTPSAGAVQSRNVTCASSIHRHERAGQSQYLQVLVPGKSSWPSQTRAGCPAYEEGVTYGVYGAPRVVA